MGIPTLWCLWVWFGMHDVLFRFRLQVSTASVASSALTAAASVARAATMSHVRLTFNHLLVIFPKLFYLQQHLWCIKYLSYYTNRTQARAALRLCVSHG